MVTNSPQKTHAFIDGQNLYRGLEHCGWKIDFRRFRGYLRDKYYVNEAYWFIGYMKENEKLYTSLQRAGFILVFKDVTRMKDGSVKGNVDVLLTLHAVDTVAEYDQAILVTSDGDFADLVRYWQSKDKLKTVLSPERDKCSHLLREAAKSSIRFINDIRPKLERK